MKTSSLIDTKPRKWHRWWEVLGGLAWLTLLLIELVHCVKIVEYELSAKWWQMLKGLSIAAASLFLYRHQWQLLASQRIGSPELLLKPLVVRTLMTWVLAALPILLYKFGYIMLVEQALMIAMPILEIVLVGFLVYWVTDAYATVRLLTLHGQEDSGKRYFRWYEWVVFSTLMLWGFGSEWLSINMLKTVLNPLLLIASLFFCVRMRWIAELDIVQRRESLIWIALLASASLVVGYLFFGLINLPIAMIGEIDGNPFLNLLLFFIIAYSALSSIVLISNFSTTLVVEKRLQEAQAFKTLGDKIRNSKDIEGLYFILYETVNDSIEVDSAWIETDEGEVILKKNIEIEEIDKIKLRFDILQHDKIYPVTINVGSPITFSKENQSKSVMAVPLQSWDEQLGVMYLVKKEANSLGMQAESLVTSFARQVSAAIHNLELLDQAVASERMQREVIIAKEVQQTLLPRNFDTDGKLQIHAVAKAAKEMGGDYYDFYRISEDEFMVVIADVSGNGVSAAFNMAEFKGIFQTLASQHLKPDELLAKANTAVSLCFPRVRFITASVFLIQTKHGKTYHARGGHCPALFWNQQQQKAYYLEGKGLGLGILRNEKYQMHVELQELAFQPGDLLVLYTDGITEALDETSTQLYGEKRLKKFVEQHADLPIKELADGIINDAKQFSNDHLESDDHSLVIIKF